MAIAVQSSMGRPPLDSHKDGLGEKAQSETNALRGRDAEKGSFDKRDKGSDDFEDYLNRTSLTAVVKDKPAHKLDAVDLISQSSVYLTPTLFSA